MKSINYENLEDYGLEFKNIISAPAPVGRILNYIILTGKGILKHKNGFREITLKDNIASAWCSEFMVGLGLIRYQVNSSGIYPIYLTEAGQKLYEEIKNYPKEFDEGVSIKKCRDELTHYSIAAYNILENTFKSSVICKNLIKYIANNQTASFNKASFFDDYFQFFKSLYDKSSDANIYNRHSRTPTASNRMPSLIQICEFFDLVKTQTIDKTAYFVFDIDKLRERSETYKFIPLTKEKITELVETTKKEEILEEELIKRFGIDGTVLHEVITRNSEVQKIFRNNLISKYGKKCAICGKCLDDVLIASHIKPAAESDVVEKADFENGLLLCALHDKLFDKYLITFDFNTGKIIVSDELEDQLNEYQLSESYKLPDELLTEKRKMYLMHHNMEFFNKRKK